MGRYEHTGWEGVKIRICIDCLTKDNWVYIVQHLLCKLLYRHHINASHKPLQLVSPIRPDE